jgi:hypothetical protein
MTTIDDLLASGGKTAKFESIGTSHTGTVISAEIRQATDPDTNKPEFWDDGNPKQQIVITLQTAERNPGDADDDGIRTVYIKAWGEQKKALQAASREAKGSPAVGDTFTATYVADGEKIKAHYTATKIFKYTIVKGNPLDAALADASPSTPVPVAAPVAAPAAPAVASVPQATITPDQEEQIKKLIALSLTDENIAKAINVPQAAAAGVRLQLAADGSRGF